MNNFTVSLVLIAFFAALAGCEDKPDENKKSDGFFQPYSEKIPPVDAQKMKPLNSRP